MLSALGMGRTSFPSSCTYSSYCSITALTVLYVLLRLHSCPLILCLALCVVVIGSSFTLKMELFTVCRVSGARRSNLIVRNDVQYGLDWTVLCYDLLTTNLNIDVDVLL